jgi:hypothetical protein
MSAPASYGLSSANSDTGRRGRITVKAKLLGMTERWVLGLARGSELWSVLPVIMPLVPSWMEDSMCWEIDYKFFAEQKKAQEARIKQEQRAGVIDQLLSDANKQGEKTEIEGTPVKEVSPAE